MSTRDETFMVIYGEQSGSVRHLARYGQEQSLCGVPISQGTRAYLVSENPPTCTTCLMLETSTEVRLEALSGDYTADLVNDPDW